MSIDAGLYTYITSDGGVAAIIGTRHYPQEAPENAALPFIVYRLSEDEEPRDLTGRVVSTKYVYELTCCDDTFDDAKTLADAVKLAVGGLENLGVQASLDGTPVILFWSDNPMHMHHVSAQDKLRHQVGIDLVILVK